MSVVMEQPTELSLSEPLFRLDRDTKEAARTMSREDARWLVDRYYEVQEDRKRAANQLRASSEYGEPCRLINWSYQSIRRYEGSIKAALGEFAAAYRVGQWLQSLCAIGPVLSAGMLVNFNVSRAPTVGHYWRFAGLDPTLKWPGREGAKKLVKSILDNGTLTMEQANRLSAATGQHVASIFRVFREGYETPKGGRKKGREGLCLWLAKRPWNARLKSFCVFRFGETQVKFCNHPKSYYGVLYIQKKAQLEQQNARGEFAEAAEQLLDSVGKTTQAHKAYSEGRLPQGQIHNQARRWMVKLFLSHLHHAMHEDYHGKTPPAPYIFDHPNGQDHRHLLLPPGWPAENGGRRLTEME